jgi:glutamine synthetase
MAKNVNVPPEQLEADIRAGRIDTVLVVFADHAGRLVGKRTDAEFYVDVVAEHGVENCDYLLACDIENTPLPGFRFASYDQGYGDMRGLVDPTTIRYTPWIERTALVLVDLVDVDTGAPVEVSPRQILQRQTQAAASAGFTVMIGSEIEFYLFRDSFEEASARGHRGLTPHAAFFEDYHILQTTKDEYVIGPMRRFLRDAGLPVEFSKGEAGRGQHELNLTYLDALRMADANVVYKNAAKEIAAGFGRSVTFMAKPDYNGTGSSCHIHSSLWNPDGTDSLMADEHGAHHMSETFRWYLGGLIATAREFTLLFAPTINSYRRYQTGSWAPTGLGWGIDNRTLGFRVVGHDEGMRVESRIPGADANSYHAFAATIAGGLFGIRNRIEPPPPYNGNGYTASDLSRIPWNIVEAIELWRQSAVAKECFGDDVHHHVLNFAEQEWRAFNQTVTDWELQRYFERI